MIKGWKKLTKEEKHHVTHDAGCRSTATFQSTIDRHARIERDTGVVQCFDCKFIAEKVGIKPKGGWTKEEPKEAGFKAVTDENGETWGVATTPMNW